MPAIYAVFKQISARSPCCKPTACPVSRALAIIELFEGPLDRMATFGFLDQGVERGGVGQGVLEGFRDRVVAGFDEVIATNGGKTVAVFCHGMVMAVYLQTLWSLEDPWRNQPAYTGIHRVTASSTNGMRSIRSINETGHVRDLLR